MEPIYGPVSGQRGQAVPLDIPVAAHTAETVCLWLITAPGYHPAWTQYLLLVVRLTDDLPGYPPPNRAFEGTTHDLMVWAVNPEYGVQTLESANEDLVAGHMPHFLWPQNVVEQYIATDDEMRKLASLCAQGIVHGLLNPDSDGRSDWLPATTRTLAHLRGETHAP